MTTITNTSKQPVRQPWTADRLLYERSILLGMAIDNSTATTYTSATNSYLTFCRLHNMPIDPTAETLSYYITFQSSHISPKSVESYLSGICNNLEPFFPEIRANRASALVKRTLKGALGTVPVQISHLPIVRCPHPSSKKKKKKTSTFLPLVSLLYSNKCKSLPGAFSPADCLRANLLFLVLGHMPWA
jgi:hypothetical protein